MTEPSHRDFPVPPRGGMTPAEVLRNIAIKSLQRRPVDANGRPTEPAAAVTYDYDEYGRITGATTRPAEESPSYSAVDVELSPAIQAMRAKAAANGQAIADHFEWTKDNLNTIS